MPICLVATQANHYSEYCMPNCQLPTAEATFIELGIFVLLVFTKSVNSNVRVL